MRMRFALAFVCVICLVFNVVSPIFAGYNVSPVEFLVYYGGLKTGSVTLHVLNVSGKETAIPAEIIRNGDQVLLKWKGDLPIGFLWLDRNEKIHLSGRYADEQIYIDLPEIPRKSDDEAVKKITIFMLFTVNTSAL